MKALMIKCDDFEGEPDEAGYYEEDCTDSAHP